MIYSCANTWSASVNPACTSGSITAVSDESQINSIMSCSVPFEMDGGSSYVKCTGSKYRGPSLSDLPSNTYLFQSDNAELAGNYLYLPDKDITNVLVSEFAFVDPEPETSGTTLTAADYSALISLVLPSFVIAWSFKMIVRQILNR